MYLTFKYDIYNIINFMSNSLLIQLLSILNVNLGSNIHDITHNLHNCHKLDFGSVDG